MKKLSTAFYCLLTFLLIGCAAQVTSVGGRTVIVKAGFPDMGIEQALILAEEECNKKAMSAVVQSVTSPFTDRYMFYCVK
jgi:uncharacterized protein YcfL